MRTTTGRIATALLATALAAPAMAVAPTVAVADDASTAATIAAVDKFTVNGINYRVLDPDQKTVELIHSDIDAPNFNMADSTYSGDFVVPASVTHDGAEYRVIGIDRVAFIGAKITSISLPEGLEYIDGAAFDQSTLSSIAIPASVKRLGGVDDNNPIFYSLNADKGSCALKSITFAEGSQLEHISSKAFNGCANVQTIEIPAGVKDLGVQYIDTTAPIRLDFDFGIFAGWKNAKNVTFATGSAFQNERGVLYKGDTLVCSLDQNISSVNVKLGTTAIGDGAFFKCRNLANITLPDGLKSIGENAFNIAPDVDKTWRGLPARKPASYDPSNSLVSINIPSTVTSVGKNFMKGAIKDDGTSLVIMQGEVPPTFGEGTFVMKKAADEEKNPTKLEIVYPASSRNLYVGENSPLASYIEVKENESGSQLGENGFELDLAVAMMVCPGKDALLGTVKVPANAVLSIASSDTMVATVDGSGKVTGVKAGAATVTASITLNGIEIATAASDVTVDHALTAVPAKEATATEAGNIAYWTCPACGKLFADDAASKEIELADTVIPAKGQEPAVKHAVTVIYGNGQPDAQLEVEDGKLLAEPTAPEREGYTFAGWFTVKNTDGTLEGEYDFNKPVTGDMTIWAGWVPVKPEEEPSTDGEKPEAGEPEDKKDAALPKTGDASMLPMAAAAIAGASSLAAGYAATKRRK